MTLTEISYYTRKLLPVGIVGLIFLVILFLIVRVLLSVLQSKQAPQIQTFNPCFGGLPALVLSTKVEYPPNVSFVLDNIEGRPVSATISASIYQLPKQKTRFGYLQKIYLMAKSLEFDTEVIRHQTAGTKASFLDFDKKLEVDVATFNFEYKYNYERAPELFENPVIPDEGQIMEEARQFLRLMGAYEEELARGQQHVIYLRFDSDTRDFLVVEGPNEANAVEVDFFRPDVDDLPAVSPTFFNSQNFVVMVFGEAGSKIIKAQVKFFPMDEQTTCSYPLKTGDQAWAELKAGQGTIVSPGDNGEQITVKKMFLGYLDPDVYQEYLQPVYVFLGDNSFAAYVPAVEESYTEKSVTQ